MSANDQLLADFQQFVSDMQASNAYLAWARDNHGGRNYSIDNPKTGSELQKWMVFRDQILRGTRPVPPTMVTALGRGLIDEGTMYLDATAPVDPPPPPPPPPPAESPDNTVIKGTVGQIVDAAGHVWKISAAGKVNVDGSDDPITSGVVELAYEAKKVWQKNSSGLWWYKTAPGDTWLPTGGTATSPVPGDTPPPPPPPPPTGKARVGTINNIGGGGSKQALLDIGAKITREDTANAADWFAQNHIDWIQIVYPGGTPHPGAYAHEVVACPVNEPYWHGVDPAVYGPQLAAEVKRVRGLNLGKPIIVPVVAYGGIAGANGMDGRVGQFPGNYRYPNGPYPIPDSWVGQIEKSAPGLLKSVYGFSAHAYFNNPPFHVLDKVRGDLAAIGCTQPFWLTEGGMYSSLDHTGDQNQVTVAKAELAALAARTDVHCYLWYRLGASSEGSASWGLVNADGSQRPAYATVKAAITASP